MGLHHKDVVNLRLLGKGQLTLKRIQRRQPTGPLQQKVVPPPPVDGPKTLQAPSQEARQSILQPRGL